MKSRLALLAVCVGILAPNICVAQRLRYKPGDVVAGKKLTGISEPAILNGQLSFRGTFLENGREQVGFFKTYTEYKSDKLVAWTGEPYHGYTLLDIHQPTLNYDGNRSLFLGTLEHGEGIFSEKGKILMEGEEIRPGVVATDLHDPVFGGNNTSAFFDTSGIYYVDSLSVLSSFPSLYGGDTMINGATSSSAAFDDNGWATFVDNTRSRVVAANDSWKSQIVLIEPGSLVGGKPGSDLAGYAITPDRRSVYIATIGSLSTLVLDQKPLFQEGQFVTGSL